VADVAQARRPQQGVHDRVQQDIGVAVPAEALFALDLHAPQKEAPIQTPPTIAATNVTASKRNAGATPTVAMSSPPRAGPMTAIGRNCTINPGVKIYHECVVGEYCIIHAGTVIGSDGFGFAPQSESEFMKIPQLGNVVIEDHVEIGANVAIDRATMGSTVIRKGVKLDNLIQIGHNVEVGENTVMAGQTGIAGSSKIGKNCMFGGQVGIAGHLKVADGVKIGAQSGISGDIRKENAVLLGYPAIDLRDFFRSSVIFKRLPDLSLKVEKLEKEIERLKKKE